MYDEQTRILAHHYHGDSHNLLGELGMKGYIFDVYKKHIENGCPKSAARFFAAVEFNRKFNPV